MLVLRKREQAIITFFPVLCRLNRYSKVDDTVFCTSNLKFYKSLNYPLLPKILNTAKNPIVSLF